MTTLRKIPFLLRAVTVLALSALALFVVRATLWAVRDLGVLEVDGDAAETGRTGTE